MILVLQIAAGIVFGFLALTCWGEILLLLAVLLFILFWAGLLVGVIGLAIFIFFSLGAHSSSQMVLLVWMACAAYVLCAFYQWIVEQHRKSRDRTTADTQPEIVP